MGNLIFVFGSNLSGIHGAGAALFAHKHRGAVWGVGEGLTGAAYALPTKGVGITFMPLPTVATHVSIFLDVVRRTRGEDEYQVTAVGCGLAGFKHEQIAPLFKDAPGNCYFDLVWKEYLPDKQFWGTY